MTTVLTKPLPSTNRARNDSRRLISSVPELKWALRRRIVCRREARSDAAVRRDTFAMAQVLLEHPLLKSARCVAVYAPRTNEIPTVPLTAALMARDVEVVIPIFDGAGHSSWRSVSRRRQSRTSPGPQRLTGSGPRGIALLSHAQVIVVPGLVVDTLGNRLGCGSGCYDRFLRDVNPSALVVAAVFDGEIYDAAVEPVPTETHDVPVDAILTPVRLLNVAPPNSRPCRDNGHDRLA